VKRRRKRWFWLGALALVLLGVGWLWNEHRTIGIEDAVNPMYWWRRAHGLDLYDPQTRILYHGNRELKEVALTIDDGPHTPTGDELLDIFKAYGVRATFFVVGLRMKERPDLIRRMIAEGHEIGNHSQNHYRLDTLRVDQARREINDCDINFCRITGRHFTLMRPPGVRYNDTVLRVADDLGYVIVFWNAAAKDFEDVTPDFIVNRILGRVENGSIILLHDDRPSTVVAMPRILEALRREGYRFVTVSEMLAHLPRPVIIESTANPRKPG
jgi:peptidoglycan/xylan/chitin deacetylase (PgdA/CDA1 family)